MASNVEICNMALAHIRGGSINSLTEASMQAQYCRLHFDTLRDQTLEDAPWQFARKIVALAPLVSVVYGYRHTYQYPSDCLRVNKLIRNNTSQHPITHPVEFRIFNQDNARVIAANETELRADYGMRVTDPNLFGSQFVMAVSYLLAAHLAIPIIGVEKGASMRTDCLNIYSGFIGSATAKDMNEQRHTPPDSEFITERF